MKKLFAALAAFALVLAIGAIGCSDEGAKVVSDSGDKKAAEEKADGAKEQDLSKLKVGTTVEMDGLRVTVKDVKKDLKNYDGSKVVCVSVKYENTSDDDASFNVFDWKAEDKNGAQRNTTFFTNGKNELGSGELAPGGKVTGNIYFDAPVKKVVYQSNIFLDEDTATWVL